MSAPSLPIAPVRDLLATLHALLALPWRDDHTLIDRDLLIRCATVAESTLRQAVAGIDRMGEEESTEGDTRISFLESETRYVRKRLAELDGRER